MNQHLEKRKDWIKGRRQKRKLARIARLRRQVLRYTMLTALVVAGVCAFTLLPGTIQNENCQIEVHGNQVATNEQVIDTLKSITYKPLFRLDPRVLEQKVCQLAVVKQAFVRRTILPRPRLRVEVLEEFPWATYVTEPGSEAQAVISQDGRMIPLSDFPTVVQPPLLICGQPGFKLTRQEIAQWDSWVRLASEQLGRPVELVDMRDKTRISLVSGTLALHIGQADSSLTKRLSRLSSVMPMVTTLGEKLQYVDLSLDSNIPLKVDGTNTTAAKEDELLRQAVKANGSGAVQTAAQNNPVEM